jgi:rod shape-determining protein MreC
LYDKQVVRRRRAVLAVLVCLSIVLLTGYFGEGTGGGPLHAFQNGAQTILSPIESGASRAFAPVRNLAGWFGDVFGAKGENDKLKKQLADARTQLAQAQTTSRDDAQLRKVLSIDQSGDFPQTKRVTARVIAKSPTAWYSTVEINEGRSAGIHVDDPVITGDGLVGKVTEASGGTAVVTLLTDSSMSVSAIIVPDGTNGQVQPSVGDPTDMQLKFIQKGHPVKKGATVVTSGFASGRLDSIYPRGIPIGRVTKVSSDELALYRQVKIQPFADFRRMDWVQVLTSKPKQPTVTPGAGDQTQGAAGP